MGPLGSSIFTNIKTIGTARDSNRHTPAFQRPSPQTDTHALNTRPSGKYFPLSSMLLSVSDRICFKKSTTPKIEIFVFYGSEKQKPIWIASLSKAL